MKTEHGGLNGTENTGYDDNSMDAYIKDIDGTALQTNEEVYNTLIHEHREHVFTQSIANDQ